MDVKRPVVFKTKGAIRTKNKCHKITSETCIIGRLLRTDEIACGLVEAASINDAYIYVHVIC